MHDETLDSQKIEDGASTNYISFVKLDTPRGLAPMLPVTEQIGGCKSLAV